MKATPFDTPTYLLLFVIFSMSLGIANHVFNLVFAEPSRRLDHNWNITETLQACLTTPTERTLHTDVVKTDEECTHLFVFFYGKPVPNSLK